MDVLILAGGRGSRLSEYTDKIPKPMVEIGGYPMLYHIMSIYSKYGYNSFIIAGGYKQEIIKEWLDNTYIPWKVQLVDTGLESKTGFRVLQLEKLLTEPFMMTYGDGVSDIDIGKLVEFHKKIPSVCTLTAVHPPSRFGYLKLNTNYVIKFDEKPIRDWVNGGFFVCEPEIFSYISGDEPIEQGALARMTQRGLLSAYKHEGFWQMMDTQHDISVLQKIWEEKKEWK